MVKVQPQNGVTRREGDKCEGDAAFHLQHGFAEKEGFKPGMNAKSKEASMLWSHHKETRELPGERNNARNNARCTKARKTTQGLDGQHQDVDRTPHGRVNQT